MEIKSTLEPALAQNGLPSAVKNGKVSLAQAVQRDEDENRKQRSKQDQQPSEQKAPKEEGTGNDTASARRLLDVVV